MRRNFLFFIGTFSFLFIQNMSASILHVTKTLVVIQKINPVNVDPIGVWDYTVVGAGSEYEKGLLFIRKENENYVVEVQLSTGVLTGQDVQIEGDTVKFNIIIEGTDRVSVVLQVEDDTISGNSYSSQGNYKIVGKRKLPQE